MKEENRGIKEGGEVGVGEIEGRKERKREEVMMAHNTRVGLWTEFLTNMARRSVRLTILC